MTNPIANTTFKMRFNGQTIKVRVMDDGERINSRCLQRSALPNGAGKYTAKVEARNNALSGEHIIEELKDKQWHGSKTVGQKVGEHGSQHRVYLEVLSAFFTPVSNDDITEPEDKGKSDI